MKPPAHAMTLMEILALSLPQLLLLLAPCVAEKIDKLPDVDFSQATTLQKIGRLTMCATALVAFLGPFLWFVFK